MTSELWAMSDSGTVLPANVFHTSRVHMRAVPGSQDKDQQRKREMSMTTN